MAAVNLNLTLGAVVVSTFFSFLTMGIVIAIAWQYFFNFHKDRLVFKILVAVVFLSSLIGTVADGVWCYHWTVTYYTEPEKMGILPMSMMIEIFCVGCTTLLVQAFFAWRVWKISSLERNYWLPGFICIMSVLQWSLVVWMVTYWSTHRAFTDISGVVSIGYAWLVSSISADLGITAGMVYYLGIKWRGQPIQSKSLFHRMISRTIQANVLSLISQVVMLALFKSSVRLYFLLNEFTMIKVYACSLILSLNMRKGFSSRYTTSRPSTSHKTPTGISLTHLSSGFRGGAGPNGNLPETIQESQLEVDSLEHDQSSTNYKIDSEIGMDRSQEADGC